MIISVVTVVRNDPLAAVTVASVLAQTGVGVESIVIDGASTDGTLRALEPYKYRVHLVSEADGGLYHAMNKGLRLACGQVVGFLNAGDVFASRHALAAVAEAFQGDPHLDAAWSGLDILGADGRRKRRWPSEAFNTGAFSRGWMPSHPSFYATRQALLDLDGFDTRYCLAADYDLMLRGLQTAAWKGRAVPGTLVHMRSGGASQRSVGAWLTHNREAWTAARRARITRLPFPLFLLQKAGRKLPQLLGR